MSSFGRLLILLGLVLVGLGILAVVLSRFNIPLGRLPGDFTWRGKGWRVSFPLATSILLSILLSLIFWAISRFHR